ETSIPEGLTPNAADMDARNGANAVTVTNQQDLLWQLGDINPGATVVIKIITDVDENNAVNPSFDRTDIIAKWGCGDATAQTSAKVNPQFVVPTGQLQVLHDTTESYFDVCQSGSITIIVRNVGITHIYDAQIEEELNSAISGIDIKQ